MTNRILWDGTSTFNSGTGLALALDADGAYPIGSTYTAPTATATTTATTGSAT
ncbi:hypothetical protein NO263_03970 [Gluconacetobacter entanii]|uniref:Uncharacterized protein n=1 Tax=Gluconacetobacter entanii TaxID=108528 RepID=A0ABT3K2W5_9PROT|nr:hypothetical protein [Gluconacetobacter entanii]MCE2580799.1 hypothetical protein [Komagataeibacter sp. FNDCR1]MCW4589734.1 hypothetical protein [Gluconacetobacter entanii]MCW4593437.1 hypothetical protein [Gluconacetobacter entanii]NPC89240.1 hypothetical protein [Gluconacetobacter entanii]